MKTKLIRYISLFLCVLTMLQVLAGCSGGAAEVKVAARTEVIAYFNENNLTEYFEKKANIKIKWVDYGSENLYERLQEDMGKKASDLPDAYLGMGLFDNEMTAIADTLFMDLTNVIDNSTVEFAKVIAEDTSRKADMEIGGRIYSYPSFYEDYANEFPQKMWVNKQWLAKVQAEMPQNVKEFKELLQAFKDNDPNGNGEEDEIPLGIAYDGGSFSTFGFLINAFLPTDFDLSDNQGYLNTDIQGNVYAGVTDERFKAALEYLNGLVDAELVSDDVFKTTPETLRDGTAEMEKYGVIAASDIRNIFMDEERLANYEPIPPLASVDGETDTTSYSRLTKVQTGGYMLAKDTEKMAEAIRFGDAMLENAGTLSLVYGAEDTGWSKADGRITAMGGATTTWKLLDTEKIGEAPFTNLKGAIPYWYSASLHMSQQAVPGDNDTVNLKTNENWGGYINQITSEIYEAPGRRYSQYALPELVISADGNMRGDIFDYLLESTRDFVTGEKDLEKDWDNYVKELDRKGLQELIDLTQKAYDRQK